MKNRTDKAIVCDVLCVSSSISALIASKICGLKTVAIVTDIYSQMVGEKPIGVMALLSKFAGALNSRYVRSFSKYVLLTEAMNDVVNPKGRPYIVMEALREAFRAAVEIDDWVKITQEDIEAVIKRTSPSISSSDLKHYENMRDEFVNKKKQIEIRPRIGFAV